MTTFQLWIEAEQTHDPIADFCNVTVTLESGDRYGLNVWAFDFFENARQTGGDGYSPSGEAQGYLVPPDLFVKNFDRTTLESVVSQLIERGQLPPQCRIPEGMATFGDPGF
jgi:hypothetical protein